MNIVTNARVTAIALDNILFRRKNAEGKIEEFSMPTNFVLWSAAIAMNPFTARVCSLL
jgi:hypothetical protein